MVIISYLQGAKEVPLYLLLLSVSSCLLISYPQGSLSVFESSMIFMIVHGFALPLSPAIVGSRLRFRNLKRCGLVVSPQSNLDHSLSAIGRFLTVSGHCQGTGGISIRYKSFWILGLLQIRTSKNKRLAQLSVSRWGLNRSQG